MCLELESRKTRVKIAKNDIVVYKALKYSVRTTINDLHKLKHGDSFIGVIKGFECEGKISIDKSGDIFFCTNDSRLNGYSAIDDLGYKYCWYFNSDVNKIIVNGEIMYDTETNGYQTFYRDFKVEIGETYTSDLINLGKRVEIGLHSFETMEDAKFYSSIVAKCIIPKGSRYYEGFFGHDVSYASDRITYVGIIK